MDEIRIRTINEWIEDGIIDLLIEDLVVDEILEL